MPFLWSAFCESQIGNCHKYHVSLKRIEVAQLQLQLFLESKLDIDLKFLGTVGSRLGILSAGSVTACLKKLGNTPVESEILNISTMQGTIESKTFRKSTVGRTSMGLEGGFILIRRAEMSSKVTGLKEDLV